MGYLLYIMVVFYGHRKFEHLVTTYVLNVFT